MKLFSYVLGVLGIFILAGAPAFAQAPFSAAGQPLPDKMTNLQYFPKNATPLSVVSTMIAFDESLGVTCDYCHVKKADGKLDFPSDEMRTKVVARRMLLFRDSINTILPQVVDKMNVPPGTPDSSIRVLCSTCHRGMPVPKQLTTLVSEAEANGGGAKAGLAKFKELRAKYYGGPSYDFSEDSLVWVAGRSFDAGKPDDAMLYLQANLEYFPKSSETYEAMGQLESVRGNKDVAIKDLEKALELDPNNMVAKNLLQRVKAK